MPVLDHVIQVGDKPFASLSSFSVRQFSVLCTAMNNPKCFFDVSCDDENIGRVVFELRADLVPKTVDNFKKLCEGFDGKSYKNNVFHRIIPGFMCQVRIYCVFPFIEMLISKCTAGEKPHHY